MIGWRGKIKCFKPCRKPHFTCGSCSREDMNQLRDNITLGFNSLKESLHAVGQMRCASHAIKGATVFVKNIRHVEGHAYGA